MYCREAKRERGEAHMHRDIHGQADIQRDIERERKGMGEREIEQITYFVLCQP